VTPASFCTKLATPGARHRGEVPECLHQNHIIRVRPRMGVRSKFALYWLLSSAARVAIETVASSSSGLQTLSISKVSGLPIPITSTTEMDLIVGRIEAAFTAIDKVAVEASRATDLLDRLDRAVLAKAFRGELLRAVSDKS
jgi:type I restriction enzyme S subunit